MSSVVLTQTKKLKLVSLTLWEQDSQEVMNCGSGVKTVE